MITDKERRRLDIPDRREHTYADLEKRLDEHVTSIEKRLHSFFMKALFIFAIIGITSATALFGFTITLSQVKETRRAFVRETCVEQNKRHDKTIAKFRAAARAAIKRSPEFAKEIRAGIQDNVDIIDALAPKQDCKKLGDVSVGEAKPPPPNIPSTSPKPAKSHKGNP